MPYEDIKYHIRSYKYNPLALEFLEVLFNEASLQKLPE